VQGVGFRPFVATLAHRSGLSGFVANTSHGVLIEVQGEADSIARFTRALQEDAPSPAVVGDITSTLLTPAPGSGFSIVPSDPNGPASTLVCPDLALCDECLAELFTPGNRRYRYPFINCTHCGPRFTIIASIPYDRPATTMATFAMCPACQAEYDDPGDRRYHAQPNACPLCGPQVTLHDREGRLLATGDDTFAVVARSLAQGAILAIKGLGGFHLAVDAGNDAAVQRLRNRKGRQEKPFALMVADLAMAHSLCHLKPQDEAILASCQRPILLLQGRELAPISPNVAPGLREFGLMLPYSPLHHLLMHANRKPLVMTSGNRSEEALCIDNNEAFSQLTEICDVFMTHNRDIVCRADDSVVMGSNSGHLILRRSRGYAPAPIMVADNGPQILAVGAELKSAVCLLKGNHAFLSQHLGDLKNLSAATFFQEAIARQLSLFAGRPELVAHDLHPDYLSTQWALAENTLPTVAVQHHHAHLAACLAENRHPGPAIGVILDGTGYGPDGTIWGGEVLIGDAGGYSRYASLEPMPLPGGDIAIREPWRAAIGYLTAIFGPEIPALQFLSAHDWLPVAEIAPNRRFSPLTSSCGRLFDAVAAMAGGRQVISYEGQAAIELMSAAGTRRATDRCYDVLLEQSGDRYQMMISPLLRQIVADLRQGKDLALISATFHQTLIVLLTKAVCQAVDHTGIGTVALSGGVFANRIILDGLHDSLRGRGLSVLTHSQVPPGDGCIALGQAIIGRRWSLS